MLLVLGRVTLLTLCPEGHFLEGEPGTRAGVWLLEQPGVLHRFLMRASYFPVLSPLLTDSRVKMPNPVD